jgi:hypothetical protein
MSKYIFIATFALLIAFSGAEQTHAQVNPYLGIIDNGTVNNDAIWNYNWNGTYGFFVNDISSFTDIDGDTVKEIGVFCNESGSNASYYMKFTIFDGSKSVETTFDQTHYSCNIGWQYLELSADFVVDDLATTQIRFESNYNFVLYGNDSLNPMEPTVRFYGEEYVPPSTTPVVPVYISDELASTSCSITATSSECEFFYRTSTSSEALALDNIVKTLETIFLFGIWFIMFWSVIYIIRIFMREKYGHY